MTVKKTLVLAVALVCMFAVIAQAQEQQQQPSTQTTAQSSSLDIQGIKAYLLGPGDVLDVRVFGQPDLSSTVQIDSDGNISSLPFLETPIKAKCRTDKEVQKEIATAYSKFINNPQVSVRISERNSRQPATVFGAVRQPTRVEMKRKVRLNELMAVSGGFTERASGTIQILHTEPLMCPGPGEEAEAAPIDGTKIPLQIIKISELRAGKADANPVIRPGDYVLVTEAEPVYITGAVNVAWWDLPSRSAHAQPCACNGGWRSKRSEAERCEDISSDSRICESGSDKRRRCRNQKEPEAGFSASGL